MWRRVTALAAVGILSWLALSGPALAAVSAPDSSAEAGFASRVQYERTSRGLSGLVQAADLVAVARKHASDMASQQRLFDDPALGQEVQSWQAVGENSGTGSSVDQVHNAFMASPPHRAIILNPSFSEVGIGVVWTGAQLWVAEVFRQPSGAPAHPSPPPPPPNTSAAPPAPVHSASPAPAAPAPAPYVAPRTVRRAAPTSPPPVAPVMTPPTTVTTPAATSAEAAGTVVAAAPAAKAQVLAVSAFRPPRRLARDLVPLAAAAAVLLLALDGGLLAQARRRVYARSKSASRS